MPFRKLNCAPLGSLIARLSASIAICPDVDLGDSLDRLKSYRSAAQPRRFHLSAWPATIFPDRSVFERNYP
jgi:hypothetical protein